MATIPVGCDLFWSSECTNNPDMRTTTQTAATRWLEGHNEPFGDAPTAFVRLTEGDLWAQVPTRTGAITLECVAGEIWVTQAGSAADVLLSPGDAFATRGTGKVIVQALTTDATFGVNRRA